MIVLIDNFDSFSHNLLDYVRRFTSDVWCVRYDKLDLASLEELQIEGILIGPGPGKPKDYPLLFDVLSRYQQSLPILGICLGHQLIGEFYGASLLQGKQPMHGKVSCMKFEPHTMFTNVAPLTQVTRYHSLVVEDLPAELEALAWSEEGELMAMAHCSLPIWGIQFHPEAVLTTDGEQMIANWVSLTNQKHAHVDFRRFHVTNPSLNVST